MTSVMRLPPTTRPIGREMRPGTRGRVRQLRGAVIAVVLVAHATLLAWQALEDSATLDEVGHFSAALEHWKHGTFRFYLVNPPLVRLVALAPVVASHRLPDPATYPITKGSTLRPEFPTGWDLTKALGAEFFKLVSLARLACVPFSLLGAWVCYRWSESLFGPWSGLTALLLWCFSPTVLGYGHLITPDVGAAALGAWAAYLFRGWLRDPRIATAAVASIGLGLAQLTKSTWLILFVLWPAMWTISRIAFIRRPFSRARSRQWRVEIPGLIAILAVAVWVLNAGYGFEGSLSRLGDYRFVSRAFTGATYAVRYGEEPPTGNRFRPTWVGSLPVPLPENYVLGVDYIKWEFEQRKWSYLNGEWRLGGWWYYYIYAMSIKEPLGTWGLALLAAVLVVSRPRNYAAPWREEMMLLLPAAAVLGLVSSQTGFNHHIRYILPAYPLIFILMSRVGRVFEQPRHTSRDTDGETPIRRDLPRANAWAGEAAPRTTSLGATFPSSLRQNAARVRTLGRQGRAREVKRPGNKWLSLIVCCLVAWLVVGSLSVFPHSLSYFNELVGGPRNGHKHLDYSNTDWGQDLLYLESWYAAHPHARPFHVLYSIGEIDPKLPGVFWQSAPFDPRSHAAGGALLSELGPRPGWFAVSVNKLHDAQHLYDYFNDLKPVDWVGYSTPVYHVTLEQANALRRRYGIPGLRSDSGESSGAAVTRPPARVGGSSSWETPTTAATSANSGGL